MNVVEAFWDHENLAAKTFEVSLVETDSLADFEKVDRDLIENKHAEYIVLKCPVNMRDFLNELPRLGYAFREATFSLSLKKANYKYPAFVDRFDRNIQVTAISEAKDLQRIYSEISSGVFDTDRVSIDKKFGVEVGNKRYMRWIDSLVQQGQKIYEVSHNADPLGFFIFKPAGGDAARGVLTGIYKKYSTSGYGVIVMKKLNDMVWEQGYKTYYAQTASNNLKSVRVNFLFGCEIDDLFYTYVKHV